MNARFALTVASIAASLFSGCGAVPASAPTGAACATGEARILVGDGITTVACGCAEAVGTVIAAGSLFTCTVNSGTRVHFLHQGTRLRHQLVSTGSPSFVSGPLNDPSTSGGLVHSVTFSSAGTYTFTDAWMPATSGRIIAL